MQWIRVDPDPDPKRCWRKNFLFNITFSMLVITLIDILLFNPPTTFLEARRAEIHPPGSQKLKGQSSSIFEFLSTTDINSRTYCNMMAEMSFLRGPLKKKNRFLVRETGSPFRGTGSSIREMLSPLSPFGRLAMPLFLDF